MHSCRSLTIAWISVFFQPEGAPVPFQVGHFAFSAHGEGDVYTSPSAVITFKTDKPGKLQALSFCNLHGLWQSSAAVKLG